MHNVGDYLSRSFTVRNGMVSLKNEGRRKTLQVKYHFSSDSEKSQNDELFSHHGHHSLQKQKDSKKIFSIVGPQPAASSRTPEKDNGRCLLENCA